MHIILFDAVLIESDWNLKQAWDSLKSKFESIRINRIRLEFKVYYRKYFFLFLIVLIESDWNLKVTVLLLLLQAVQY